MPFRNAPGEVWKTWVRVPGERPRRLTLDTTDRETAVRIEAMVKTLTTKRRWDELRLALRGETSLGAMYDAYERGALDDFIRSLRAPDLSPLVEEWNGNALYKLQVRKLIPAGQPFPATDFTRRRIAEFLSALEVTGGTRNKYRAALSSFARWLMDREIITTNPALEVRASKANPPRLVWLERDHAKSLIAALPLLYRAAEALMAATGMELQAIERVRGRDIDFAARTVRAHGSKNPWRDRTVRATEQWAWDIFAAYVRDVLPNGLVFERVTRETLRKHHKETSAKLGLPVTTLHDWRHSYAVWSLRDGLSPTTVARQLGHKDAILVFTVYGRYIPDERDYVTHAARQSKVEREA